MLLRTKAREQGFLERIRYSAETGFDWNQLFSSGQTMSLFAEKRLIELRIPTGKPGDVGAKALVEYTSTPTSDDTILAIISGGIERRTQKSKWFTSLESNAVTTECPKITAAQLPKWIAERFTAMGVSYERDAILRMSQNLEGNLLAAAQEVNLLALLATDQKVTVKLVDQSIADHARFNIFSFVDACLAGKPARLTRVLQSLKREQSEPILILWSLTKEARALCQLATIQQQGGHPQSNFQRYGIWGPRTGLMTQALKRLSLDNCQQLLGRLAKADLQLKGRAAPQRADIWEEIESIGLALGGVSIP